MTNSEIFNNLKFFVGYTPEIIYGNSSLYLGILFDLSVYIDKHLMITPKYIDIKKFEFYISLKAFDEQYNIAIDPDDHYFSPYCTLNKRQNIDGLKKITEIDISGFIEEIKAFMDN